MYFRSITSTISKFKRHYTLKKNFSKQNPISKKIILKKYHVVINELLCRILTTNTNWDFKKAGCVFHS